MEQEFKLSDDQQIEYNTVILAGLLHDVGKFINRIERHGFPKHPLASVMFINKQEVTEILQRKEMGIDIELLKTLVQRHHEHPKYFPKNQLVQELTDPHQRALAYIVSRADNFSSSERDDEEERAFIYFKNYRIYSTFSLVNLTKNSKGDKYYKLQEFSEETMFPVNQDELNKNTFSYQELEPKLMDAIKNFKPENFKELFNGFLTIFRKYLWAVPSDTWKIKSDISLFDHLSTTSAIAASLYRYHFPDFDEEKIKNDEADKFLLIGGDLSGIQDFLFEIHQQNPRKLSKILRGRSFLLSMMPEIVSHKILTALKLPFSARLMSSGGRFVILAPNLGSVEQTLETIRQDIEEEFFGLFLGKLTMVLNFKTVLSGKDLALGKFKDKINENNADLISRKLNKHLSVLKDGKHAELLKKPHGHSLQENEPCSFCGVYPKTKKGKDERCLICTTSEELGKEIPGAKFLHFIPGPGIGSFSFLNTGIQLSPENRPGGFSYILEEPGKDEYHGNLFYSIANYLPGNNNALIGMDNTNENTLCFHCSENDLETQCKTDTRKIYKDETYLSFECIAADSRRKCEGKGADKLAVFKADIDNLGYMMQYGFGFDNPGITLSAGISPYKNPVVILEPGAIVKTDVKAAHPVEYFGKNYKAVHPGLDQVQHYGIGFPVPMKLG